MNRYKSYNPYQSVFLPFDTEQLFPAGSFEKFIVDTLNSLDLGCFSNDHEDCGGEAPYDSRSILGVLFLGYSKGIFSSRKLSLSCQRDFGFMYVSGFCTPDHSTICRFLNNNTENLKSIFVQLLFFADEMGYLDYSTLAIDGTKIKANASKDFTGTIGAFQKKKNKLEEKIEKSINKQKTTDDLEERENLSSKVDRYEKSLKKIRTFLNNCEPHKGFNGKELQQNITDNDCRLMKSKDCFIPAYNAQACSDVKSGIIVAAEVLNHSNDRHAFSLICNKLKKMNRPWFTGDIIM